MTTDKPTPIVDFIDRIADHDPGLLAAATTTIALLAFAVGESIGIVWLAAGGGINAVLFGGLAVAVFGWRRFKQWRYPSYYDTEEA